jgi:ribonuclease BN (tRNA processing enzyme)
LVVVGAALNHPGGCFGYRFEERRNDGTSASMVFATDTEHSGRNNAKLQKLARGADVLMHDAQYSEDEYEGRIGIPRKGWGHSTWNRCLHEAVESRVRHLLLIHHDPLHDDWAIARIENEARKEGLKTGIEVDAAYEGLELEI